MVLYGPVQDQDALGSLLDLKIKYYATVNLGGFVSVVNTLGGVNVDVARPEIASV